MGGTGGSLSLTILGDANFSTHHTVLGTTGGVGGTGGQGGGAQGGGNAGPPSGLTAQSQFRGAGGALEIIVDNGNITFASGTVFGGIGGIGGTDDWGGNGANFRGDYDAGGNGGAGGTGGFGGTNGLNEDGTRAGNGELYASDGQAGQSNAHLVGSDFIGAGKIQLLQGAQFTGNFDGFTGNMTVTENKKLLGDMTVTNGMTLDVTATQNADDAPIQDGNLTINSGGTLRTTFVDYTIPAGGTVDVYIGNNMTGFTNNGTETTVANRLYRIVGDLNYVDNSLFYVLERNFSADLFPNISPQLGPVIDDYQGGNPFIENLITSGITDAKMEIAVQSGFDIVNLAAPMSALYETKNGIGNVLYTRSQLSTRCSTNRGNAAYRGQCNPCDAVSQSNRETWVAPICGNARGFGLMSGNFRHDYVNDQYAMGFGIDKVEGATRFGVMGVGGWGKVRSQSVLAPTKNDTSFGGVYAYSNTRRGDIDLLLSAG